ncbi:MAG: hypothetical protein HYX75_23870 [Acidobacteria bacterium]|nr:hypothetical protein [Acidobacteriota bacterium]
MRAANGWVSLDRASVNRHPRHPLIALVPGFLLLVVSAPSRHADPGAVARVNVDFAAKRSVKSMAGMLNGIGCCPVVSDAWFASIEPRIVRGSLPEALLSEGPAVGKLALMRHLKSRYVLVVSSLWGYPLYGWHHHGNQGAGQPPWVNWAMWENFVVEQVARVRRAGASGMFIYDVWNEPDGEIWWTGTRTQLYDTYRRAERKIHALDPSAAIAGPSLSGWDPVAIENFLNACLSTGTQVNVLTWHELLMEPPAGTTADYRDFSEVTNHLKYARSRWLKSSRYAPLKIREIHINEHVGADDFLRPGEAVAFLAALEAGGADAAARSCWDPPAVSSDDCWNGSLGGLLDQQTCGPVPRSLYWVYDTYPDGVATRVTGVASSPSLAILASASDRESGFPQILLGHNRMVNGAGKAPFHVSLTLENLQALKPFATASTITIEVLGLPDSQTQPLPSPPLLLRTTAPVRDGTATIALPSIALHSAQIVRIRK